MPRMSLGPVSHDDEQERSALNAVRWGAERDGPDLGWCPTWELPRSIPLQRFQGFERRGLLRFSPARGWRLTEAGEARRFILNNGKARDRGR